MDNIDEHLAQSLFEKNAHKCNSNEERIAFCKAYLKKLGIDTEPKVIKQGYDPSMIQKLFNNNKETFTFHASESVDRETLMRYSDPMSVTEKVIKPALVNKILVDLVKHDFFHFEMRKDAMNDRQDVIASIKVCKWS